MKRLIALAFVVVLSTGGVLTDSHSAEALVSLPKTWRGSADFLSGWFRLRTYQGDHGDYEWVLRARRKAGTSGRCAVQIWVYREGNASDYDNLSILGGADTYILTYYRPWKRRSGYAQVFDYGGSDLGPGRYRLKVDSTRCDWETTFRKDP